MVSHAAVVQPYEVWRKQLGNQSANHTVARGGNPQTPEALTKEKLDAEL